TIGQDLARIADEVEELLSHRTDLEGSLREHEQQLKDLEPFAAVPIPLELYHGYETVAVFAGSILKDVTIDVPHEKYFRGGKEGGFLVVFVPKEHANTIEQKLGENGFTPLPIPKGEGLPEDLTKAHNQAISELSEQMGQIEKRIKEIRANQAEFLVSSEELLTCDVEQAEAPLRFAVTEQAFVAEGWVPTNEVERLKSGLNRATNGKIYIVDRPVEEHEESPVEYDNVSFAKPSQFLMDLYARPRYDEFDPTIFMAILFPVFFGMILGDVGYGALLLIVALGLRRIFKSGDGRQLTTILTYASISSIIFGLLFSEFFGFELPWHPIIFSRHLGIGAETGGAGADVAGLIMITIWIGILQITLGRGLNAYTEFKHHGLKGVIGQGGWLAVMWGILLAIWANFAIPLMPDLTAFPAVILGLSIPTIIGLVMVLLGIVGIAMESALEVIELPTIISHTLSYVRLAAVGLSSVAIAMVVNYIAIGMLIQPALSEITALGIVLIILGVLVF
ncbi:MAG TPA: V-type ATP synthase subunit I, partial [Methanomicrobiales archaeon]|nr:V-type ATP synthase subunit I [Methanomicrobiales archaeon]